MVPCARAPLEVPHFDRVAAAVSEAARRRIHRPRTSDPHGHRWRARRRIGPCDARRCYSAITRRQEGERPARINSADRAGGGVVAVLERYGATSHGRRRRAPRRQGLPYGGATGRVAEPADYRLRLDYLHGHRLARRRMGSRGARRRDPAYARRPQLQLPARIHSADPCGHSVVAVLERHGTTAHGRCRRAQRRQCRPYGCALRWIAAPRDHRGLGDHLNGHRLARRRIGSRDARRRHPAYARRPQLQPPARIHSTNRCGNGAVAVLQLHRTTSHGRCRRAQRRQSLPYGSATGRVTAPRDHRGLGDHLNGHRLARRRIGPRDARRRHPAHARRPQLQLPARIHSADPRGNSAVAVLQLHRTTVHRRCRRAQRRQGRPDGGAVRRISTPADHRLRLRHHLHGHRLARLCIGSRDARYRDPAHARRPQLQLPAQVHPANPWRRRAVAVLQLHRTAIHGRCRRAQRRQGLPYGGTLRWVAAPADHRR